MATVTLKLTEIDKIVDALVGKAFSGGAIKITETEREIVIRDTDELLVAKFERIPDEERFG